MLELKITEKEKLCLEALEETCKKYEMEEDYCIGENAEQKVCLYKKNENWEVFIVERGLQFDKTKHKECIDACLEVLNQCSYSIDEFKDASNDFRNLLLKNKMMIKKCKLKTSINKK